MERLLILHENMTEAIRDEASLFTHLRNERISLRDFILNIIKGFESTFSKKGLYLKTDITDTEFVTDPEKLSIVLRNLLINALKFTEEGGITIKAYRDMDNVIITVSDTERGIKKEDIPHIFRRFYKSDDSSGFGIGLSIVYELVKLLNGEITVTSTVGSGSEFRITLNG